MSKPWRVFTVHESYNTDGEGMGRHCGTIGFFTRLSDAQKATQGNPYTSIKEVNVLQVGDDYFLLKENDPIDLDNKKSGAQEALRKKALSKLSSEERVALGLKE